jgi:hypothetical protein
VISKSYNLKTRVVNCQTIVSIGIHQTTGIAQLNKAIMNQVPSKETEKHVVEFVFL